jgi:hypothetical protein
MRRIRIRAIWAGTTYPVFNGFVESWPVEFPEKVDQVTRVRLVDGFKLLSLAAVSGSFPAQSSGARVAAVLEVAGWPSVESDVDIGDATVPAAVLENVSALAHIQDVERAEGGRFFMSRSGVATFRSRHAGANEQPETTWADDGTGLTYRDVRLTFDDELITNDVRLTREGGVEQVVLSGSSEAKYGRRSEVQTNVLLNSDVAVAELGQWYLDRYDEPILRLEQLVDNAMRHQQWDQVLPREINDKAIAIETKTQTAQLSSIEGIGHDVTPDSWTITVNLAPTVVTQVGIWDDPVSGLWDDTFIWAR